MKFRILAELLVPGLLAGAIGFGPAILQDQDSKEVEIVDQDGQSVDAMAMKWQDDGQDSGIDVQVGDGKIIIVDKNGERREIDVTGAQNIIVNKSVRSIIRDGEKEKQVAGKAIIVGPDGKRQVIELGDLDGRLELGVELDGLGGMLRMIPTLKGEHEDGEMPLSLYYQLTSGGKFAIGVSCEPVSESLRAQLDLEDGMGLVITSQPGDDTPAAKAGIQLHDILIRADQSNLAAQEDLVEAIQLAGKEERELSLTLIRRGKETHVDVKPTARKELPNKGVFQFKPDGEEFDLRVEKFGPGVIFEHDGELPADVMEQLQSMRERMMQQTEELDELRENLQKSMRKSRDRDRDDDQ